MSRVGFRKLFRRIGRARDRALPEPFCPKGRRIYCIGDIHGRLDLLIQLHELIRLDAADYAGGKTLIYLGDYIDRGEQAKAVLDLLVSEPLAGFESVFLRGNHEQTMLDFLEHAEVGRAWITFGGYQTLASYDALCDKYPTSKEDFQALQRQLQEKIPNSHLDFLERTVISHAVGSYYFVHAGIRPGTAIDSQKSRDQLWIRNKFTESAQVHEKIIVHGHSATSEPEFRPSRIGLDTGAYYSGKLTCLILEGASQQIVQTDEQSAGLASCHCAERAAAKP